MGGLNKSARTAFEEPIGRTRREQDLPWDRLSVAARRRRRPKIPDFHRERVCEKGAVGSSMRDPPISDTVRILSVGGWCVAGWQRNGSAVRLRLPEKAVSDARAELVTHDLIA